MIFGDKKRRSLHWAEAFGASAVVHLGAAILVFDLLDGFSVFDPREQPEPEIIITSIILEGELDPIPQEPLTNDPLSETPSDAETPETPVEPDTAPEEPAEGDPEPADITDMVPETLAPVDTQTATALQPVTQLRPQDGLAVPVAPTTTLAPVTTAPRVDQVTATAIQPLQTVPTPPPSVQAPTPQGPVAGGVVSELVTRIRGRLADPCLLAIPRESGDGGPELVMLGANEAGMRSFANAVLADLTPVPGQTRVLVDSRQCAALNFVRENRFYPAFRLSVSLDQGTVESGSNLTGSIGNTAGRYISLLLVDDNGVVQDLGQFLSFTGSAARFDAPVTRDGNARDTSQALIALATATRPATLNAQNGQLADDFFAALRTELGPDTPLVLVPFDVR